MKVFRSWKLWSLIVGAVIGGVVWQGFIIDSFARGNIPELWTFGIMTYIIVASLCFRKDISYWVDKWE